MIFILTNKERPAVREPKSNGIISDEKTEEIGRTTVWSDGGGVVLTQECSPLSGQVGGE